MKTLFQKSPDTRHANCPEMKLRSKGHTTWLAVLLMQLTLCALLLAANSTHTAVRYVDVSSSNATPPYTNWALAATRIQDAVDTAEAGDEIVVTNGVYATGGRAVGTNVLANRVAVDKLLTLRSMNGPEFTIIQGYQVPGTTNGDGAIRCVYLADGASLSGFTLTNGATRKSDTDDFREESGGGVWCESTNAAVFNCVVVGNSADDFGGGAYGGTLNNCTLTGNSAAGWGGGAWGGTLNIHSSWFRGEASVSTLNNCTLSGNSALAGGGAAGGILNNCTLTGNSAAGSGGGAYDGTLNNCTLTGNSADNGGGTLGGSLNNCIVYFNTAPIGANYFRPIGLPVFLVMNYCCTTPLPTNGFGFNGLGNITNAPLFVDDAGGNLRLQSGSPCINAGRNALAPVGPDLDGNPRVVNGTVDIGAYEFQGSGSVISYAWLQRYGLPTDGSADTADPDGDGLDSFQEWRCLTDPANALSRLRLLSPQSTHGTNVTVSWQSVEGVSYFLDRSTDLSPSSFTPLASDILGQPGTTTFMDTNAVTGPRLFYRVGVGF
jgi:hypothetical protein